MNEAAQDPVDPYVLALIQIWDEGRGFEFNSGESPDYCWPPPLKPLGIIDLWITIGGGRPWGFRVPVPGRGAVWHGFDQSMTPATWASRLVDWIELQVTNAFPLWADHDDDGVVRYVRVDERGSIRRWD